MSHFLDNSYLSHHDHYTLSPTYERVSRVYETDAVHVDNRLTNLNSRLDSVLGRARSYSPASYRVYQSNVVEPVKYTSHLDVLPIHNRSTVYTPSLTVSSSPRVSTLYQSTVVPKTTEYTVVNHESALRKSAVISAPKVEEVVVSSPSIRTSTIEVPRTTAFSSRVIEVPRTTAISSRVVEVPKTTEYTVVHHESALRKSAVISAPKVEEVVVSSPIVHRTVEVPRTSAISTRVIEVPRTVSSRVVEVPQASIIRSKVIEVPQTPIVRTRVIEVPQVVPQVIEKTRVYYAPVHHVDYTSTYKPTTSVSNIVAFKPKVETRVIENNKPSYRTFDYIRSPAKVEIKQAKANVSNEVGCCCSHSCCHHCS